jgi:hypothetical protein
LLAGESWSTPFAPTAGFAAHTASFPPGIKTGKRAFAHPYTALMTWRSIPSRIHIRSSAHSGRALSLASDASRRKKIMLQNKQVEPPSRLKPPVLMVGQDCRGNWVVQDHSGERGGLFVSRDAALRYVRDENRDRQRSVVMISGILELDVNRRPPAAIERQSAPDDQRLRRVA